MADILFGDVNPSGKLPISYPRQTNDVVPYDHKPLEAYEGNQYRPLYPFAHGLSYTSFATNGLRLSTDKIELGESIDVTVNVKNTGARTGKDGLDGVHVHMTNTSNLPVEALENEYPLTLLRYELVDDSGGVGMNRGGMGLRRVYRADADCRVRVDVSRVTSKSWGLQGGGSGGHGAIECGPGVVFDRDSASLKAGQWFAIVSPGAGGYGPASARDKKMVARDLAEGAISAATARDAYDFSA